MEDGIETGAARSTPTHLWVVGGLALIWNAFGGYDYLMTRMRDTDYLAGMMPGVPAQTILDWIDSFPLWAQVGWGLGVWMGVLGSVLLMMKSRHAVLAFLLSLVGMALSFGYQFMGPPPPAGLNEGAMGMVPLLIIAVGIALFLYARSMRAKGVLA